MFVWMMPFLKEDQLGTSQNGDPQITERMLGQRIFFFFPSKCHKKLVKRKEEKHLGECPMDSLGKDKP